MKLFTGWSWLSVLLPGCFEDDAHSQAVKPLCAGFCIQLLKGFYWSRRARRQQRCLFSLHPIPLTFLSVFSFTLYSRGPGRSWLLLQAINMFITHTLVQVGIDLLIVFWQSSKYARHRNTLKTLLSQILWRNKPFYCRNQFIWIHDTVLFAASSFSNLSDAFSSLYFWGVMSPFSQHYQVFKVSVLMNICSSLSSSVTWPPPCWRATVVLIRLYYILLLSSTVFVDSCNKDCNLDLN